MPRKEGELAFSDKHKQKWGKHYRGAVALARLLRPDCTRL